MANNIIISESSSDSMSDNDYSLPAPASIREQLREFAKKTGGDEISYEHVRRARSTLEFDLAGPSTPIEIGTVLVKRDAGERQVDVLFREFCDASEVARKLRDPDARELFAQLLMNRDIYVGVAEKIFGTQQAKFEAKKFTPITLFSTVNEVAGRVLAADEWKDLISGDPSADKVLINYLGCIYAQIWAPFKASVSATPVALLSGPRSPVLKGEDLISTLIEQQVHAIIETNVPRLKLDPEVSKGTFAIALYHDRVQRGLSRFANELTRLVEIDAAVDNVIRLVRTRIDPEQFATTTLNRTSILGHESLVEMSRNWNILQLAMKLTDAEMSAPWKAEWDLQKDIEIVYGAIMQNERLDLMSINEFKKQFMMRRIDSLLGHPIAMVVAKNVAGAGNAQITKFFTSSEQLKTYDQIVYPHVEALFAPLSKAMVDACASKNTFNFLADHLGAIAAGQPLTSQSEELPFIKMFLRDGELELLAASLSEVRAVKKASGEIGLVYSKALDGTRYIPSVISELKSVLVTPYPEEILIASDSFEAMDHFSVAEQCIPKEYRSMDVRLTLRDETVRMNAGFHAELAWSRDVTYKVSVDMLEMLRLSYLRDLRASIPYLDASLVGAFFVAVKLSNLLLANHPSEGQIKFAMAAQIKEQLDVLGSSDVVRNLVDSLLSRFVSDGKSAEVKIERNDYIRQKKYRAQAEVQCTFLLLSRLGLITLSENTQSDDRSSSDAASVLSDLISETRYYETRGIIR